MEAPDIEDLNQQLMSRLQLHEHIQLPHRRPLRRTTIDE